MCIFCFVYSQLFEFKELNYCLCACFYLFVYVFYFCSLSLCFFFGCFVLLFFYFYYCHLGHGSSLLVFVFFSYRSGVKFEGEKGVWFFVAYVASLIFCCCKGDVKLEGGFFFFLDFLCCMLFFVRLGLFPLYFFVYFFNFSCFIIFVSIWSFVQLHKR